MARSTADSPSNDKLSRMLRVANAIKEISKYSLVKIFEYIWSVIINFKRTKYTKAAYADRKDISYQNIESKVKSIPYYVSETSDDPYSNSPNTTSSSSLYTPSVPHPRPGSSTIKPPKNQPTKTRVDNTSRTTPTSDSDSYTLQVEEKLILQAFKNSEFGYYKSYPLSFIVLSRYLYRQKFWTNQLTNNLIKNANTYVKDQTFYLKNLGKPGLEQLLYWSTVLFHIVFYIDCSLRLTYSYSKKNNRSVNEEQIKYIKDMREHIAKSLEDGVKAVLGIIFKEIGLIFNGHFSGTRSESLSDNFYNNFYSFWSFLEDISKQARLPQPLLDLIMAAAHNSFRIFGYNQFLQNPSKSCRKDEAEMFVKLCDLLQNRLDVQVEKNQDKVRENDQNRETEKEDLLTLVTPSFLLRGAAKYAVKVWKYVESNRGRRLLDEISDLQATSNRSYSNSEAMSNLSPEAMRLIAGTCSKIALSENQEKTDYKSLWEDLQRGINLSNLKEGDICKKELLDKKVLSVSIYLNSYMKKNKFELSIIQEKELKIPMPWRYLDEKDVAHKLLEELGFE